jgi:hypothetical protein
MFSSSRFVLRLRVFGFFLDAVEDDKDDGVVAPFSRDGRRSECVDPVALAAVRGAAVMAVLAALAWLAALVGSVGEKLGGDSGPDANSDELERDEI